MSNGRIGASIREYLERIIDERDRLYDVRFRAAETAVNAALAAQEKQTNASFSASEKAIVKAEDSQKSYNVGHNDLSRKMEDQYKSMVPYSEARLKWDSVDKELIDIRKESAAIRDMLMKEIAGLRESRATVSGKDAGITVSWGVLLGVVALVSSLILIGSFVVENAPAVPAPAPQIIYVPAPAGALLPTTPASPVQR